MLFRSATLFIIAVFGLVSASALTCKTHLPPHDLFLQKLFRDADIIVLGIPEWDGRKWRVQVEKVWKGEVPPTIFMAHYQRLDGQSGEDLIFADGSRAAGHYFGRNCLSFLTKDSTVAELTKVFGPGEKPREDLDNLTVSWFLAAALTGAMVASTCLFFAVRFLLRAT